MCDSYSGLFDAEIGLIVSSHNLPQDAGSGDHRICQSVKKDIVVQGKQGDWLSFHPDATTNDD